jgi:transglutaminase-like putative cysteine protease
MRFSLDMPHKALTVLSESIVEVDCQVLDQNAASVNWEVAASRPLIGTTDLEVELYRIHSPMAPYLKEALHYAQPSFQPRRPWLDGMLDLTRRIRSEFVYDPEATTITTGVEEVIKNRRGVCQDFAHLMISCLRSLGIPARYVSGYVLNLAASGATPLVGADASHAWVAGHCPGLGWVAFDPTNGKLANLEFVTLGWGREFSDVTPLRGVVLGSAAQTLTVAVRVEKL